MRRGLALAARGCAAGCARRMAGTGGTWTPVTPNFDQNFNLVGLHRTADGVLHVVAQAKNARQPAARRPHPRPDRFGRGGRRAVTITSRLGGVEQPGHLARTPAAGCWPSGAASTARRPAIRSTTGSFATSDDSGAAWTVDPSARGAAAGPPAALTSTRSRSAPRTAPTGRRSRRGRTAASTSTAGWIRTRRCPTTTRRSAVRRLRSRTSASTPATGARGSAGRTSSGTPASASTRSRWTRPAARRSARRA